MYISLLAKIEDSILPISLDGYTKIVAIQAKVYYIKTISEASLNPFDLYNAQSND